MVATYESKENREAESAAALLVETVCQCEILQTPTHAQLDWIIYRGGRLVGFGEFKQRKRWYDPVTVSKSKIDAMLAVMRSFSVPVYFYAEFLDREDPLNRLKLDNWQSWKVTEQSRKNPRDNAGDVNDPVYNIPFSEFAIVRTDDANESTRKIPHQRR